MAVGKSGRIVVEIEATDKRKIYASLKARGLTMREWFLQKVDEDEMRGSSSRKAGDFRVTQREST